MTIDFDSITIDDLRRRGGVKWSAVPGAIGAFVAEMDFGVAPNISRALHAAIDDGVLGYLPSALGQQMSAATARWTADRYGWTVDPADVHPLPDVLAGLRLAIDRFSRAGAPVIVPTPAYMPFLTVPPSLGREVIEVPMLIDAEGRYTLDLDGIDAAFRAGANLLVLCNPYNPVGRVFTRDELVAVGEVVQRHDGRVFSDEIHAPLVYAPGIHVPYASISPEAAAHTVTTTSASKAWNLPGLKAAQLILSSDADREAWDNGLFGIKGVGGV